LNGYRDFDPATGRYVESDPIGLGRGVNTYAYVGGNPVMGVDPLGLFTSDQHAAMTYEVLASGGAMLPCLREAIAGAIGLDFAPGSQSISSAYLHAMAQPGQSAAAAAKQSNDYIYSEIGKCNCTALGYALHTAQDSAAGGHQYKTYYGPESMWSVAGLIHVIRDYWLSEDRRTEAIEKSRSVVSQYKAHCKGCLK
jgi:hypothetical protein